jgi:hypothetical protein
MYIVFFVPTAHVRVHVGPHEHEQRAEYIVFFVPTAHAHVHVDLHEHERDIVQSM